MKRLVASLLEGPVTEISTFLRVVAAAHKILDGL